METVRAPEFDAAFAWLNTDRPLRFAHELVGHVVLLDFWTYCCINCLHILPDLKFLEQKYKDEPFLVVGVHSAKFPNETSLDTIRSAIHRYEIRHPVVVDEEMKLWQAYAARSWPTFVIIDPEGYIVGQTAGEGNRETLDRAIGETLLSHRKRGTLAEKPLELTLDRDLPSLSGLAYPGKVLADRENGRIYVSDSNHHRVIVAGWPSSQGVCKVERSIVADFNQPQGLALGLGQLFIADTENHRICAVDLSTWEVTTLIGTGVMTNDRAGGKRGKEQGINSPWDLVVEGSTLYVAMAGTHQIWRIEIPIKWGRAFAGTGRENLVDGPTESAALAQPSGICAYRGNLYFADSEVSAIRGIDMAAEKVFTLAGHGLFIFGDLDGDQQTARFQHPLGVAGWKNGLLIADTYNHKIKHMDLDTKETVSLYGGDAKLSQGRLKLFEPGGLSVDGDDLFIADTNHHRIVRIDLNEHAIQELRFEGLEVGKRTHPAPVSESVVELPLVEIDVSKQISLSIDIALPANEEFNPMAPCSIQIRQDKAVVHQQTSTYDQLPIETTLSFHGIAPKGEWQIDFRFATCDHESTQCCFPRQISWRVPIRAGKKTGLLLSAKLA